MSLYDACNGSSGVHLKGAGGRNAKDLQTSAGMAAALSQNGSFLLPRICTQSSRSNVGEPCSSFSWAVRLLGTARLSIQLSLAFASRAGALDRIATSPAKAERTTLTLQDNYNILIQSLARSTWGTCMLQEGDEDTRSSEFTRSQKAL